MSLKDLTNLQPLYILPKDNLVGDVIVPCLQLATSYDCMTAFFQSGALREMAPGLADFIAHSEGKMRLLVSPYLSLRDQEAIKEGLNDASTLIAKRLEELCGSAEVNADALVKHTLECLAYLIASDRIQIKLVLVKNGLFHPKVRIFSDGAYYIAVHGSNNLTVSGLLTNVEQVMVSRSWTEADQQTIVSRLMKEFEAIWNGETSEYIRTYDAPQAFKDNIVKEYLPPSMPTSDDFWQAYKKDNESPSTRDGPQSRISENGDVFKIPSNVVYEHGDFAHQGKAVRAWEEAGRQGILEMATGSGKTIASLIAGKRLFDEVKQLLIVIAAPYLPLISQWAEEVGRFGLDPIIPGRKTNRSDKLACVRSVTRNLKAANSKIECVIVTHDFLCDSEFHSELSRYSGPAMLIADEVHNLGTQSFLNATPGNFGYRLGLSATPVRQYDDVGTDALKAYFGDVVFRFTLQEAIGKCLVPYDYYVCPVQLTPDEFGDWSELNDRIKKLGWMFGDDQKASGGGLPIAIQKLLNKRRLLLEQASNKTIALRDILKKSDPYNIKHTLIYTSDKGRSQINAINQLLMNEFNLRIHQITQEETSKYKLADELLNEFAQGNIQVLTAMRVLDEGVDIPEVSKAFILASTTVERQWVQRRGRVLRKCPRINKQFSIIHDFLVVPGNSGYSTSVDPDALKIIKNELTRIMEFAKLSRNATSSDGALGTIRPIIEEYF